MTDDWEEMFALAEGRGTTEHPSGETTNADPTQHNKKARKSSYSDERPIKRASRKNWHKNSSELQSDCYLNDRCRPEPADFEGCRLSRSFTLNSNNTPVCKRWKQPQHHQRRACQRCHRAPGEHMLKLDDEADDWTHTSGTMTPLPSQTSTTLMALFVTVRNMRGWCRGYWLSTNSRKHSSTIAKSLAPLITQLQNWMQRLQTWLRTKILEGLIMVQSLFWLVKIFPIESTREFFVLILD